MGMNSIRHEPRQVLGLWAFFQNNRKSRFANCGMWVLQTFLGMVRQRQHEQLRPWMEAAATSGIAEIQSFVVGIEQDYAAVKAALRLPWSQGVTEWKVNKLKTLKRAMYGQAGFALLRQRLLHRA